MADKNNKSDTLDQQRKAREEFLHLKRMQSGDEAPPEPTPEITPETINEKAKNFWYYYRWPVIGLIFIIIVVAICVVQCASKVKYDLRIVLYTSKAVSDADCEHIAEYFKKYAEDSNNDGKVNVEVVNCSYTAGTNGQSIMAINTKIQAIIAAEYDVMLFITDDTTFMLHTKKLDLMTQFFKLLSNLKYICFRTAVWI